MKPLTQPTLPLVNTDAVCPVALLKKLALYDQSHSEVPHEEFENSIAAPWSDKDSHAFGSGRPG